MEIANKNDQNGVEKILIIGELREKIVRLAYYNDGMIKFHCRQAYIFYVQNENYYLSLK